MSKFESKVEEKREAPAKVEKTARVFHTDSGYGVEQSSGEGVPVSSRSTKGLEGLFATVKELQKSGFKVTIEAEELE